MASIKEINNLNNNDSAFWGEPVKTEVEENIPIEPPIEMKPPDYPKNYPMYDDGYYRKISYKYQEPIFTDAIRGILEKESIKPIIEESLAQPTLEMNLEENNPRESKVRPFNKIAKVGIEIEGAWIKEKKLHNDASFSRADFSPDFPYVGEFVSEPFDNPQDLFQSIKENWPDATCEKTAYHIHVSFKNVGCYSVLMEYDFFEYFLLKMEKWAKSYPYKGQDFWTRWLGKNRYASREHIPDVQAAYKEKGVNRLNRRTILHYQFGIFKTLENRLFPTFKEAKTAISATKAFINCVEDYLEANPPQEKCLQENIVDDGQELQLFETPVVKEKLFFGRRDVIAPRLDKPFNFFEVYDPNYNKDVPIYTPGKRKVKDLRVKAEYIGGHIVNDEKIQTSQEKLKKYMESVEFKSNKDYANRPRPVKPIAAKRKDIKTVPASYNNDTDVIPDYL